MTVGAVCSVSYETNGKDCTANRQGVKTRGLTDSEKSIVLQIRDAFQIGTRRAGTKNIIHAWRNGPEVWGDCPDEPKIRAFVTTIRHDARIKKAATERGTPPTMPIQPQRSSEDEEIIRDLRKRVSDFEGMFAAYLKVTKHD